MNRKEWARDFLALGSWVFFVLVAVRLGIGDNDVIFNRILIAGVVLLLVDLFFKGNVEGYVSKAIVISVFTGLNYQDLAFSIFAFLAVLGVIFSSKYLGRSNWNVSSGVLVGVVASLVGYYGQGLF
jgi:hypothetical protein